MGCYRDTSNRAIPKLEEADPLLLGAYQDRENATESAPSQLEVSNFSHRKTKPEDAYSKIKIQTDNQKQTKQKCHYATEKSKLLTLPFFSKKNF